MYRELCLARSPGSGKSDQPDAVVSEKALQRLGLLVTTDEPRWRTAQLSDPRKQQLRVGLRGTVLADGWCRVGRRERASRLRGSTTRSRSGRGRLRRLGLRHRSRLPFCAPEPHPRGAWRQLVSHPPHRDQQTGVSRIGLELPPQLTHMHRDHAGVYVCGLSPDLGEQLLRRVDPAGVAGQGVE